MATPEAKAFQERLQRIEMLIQQIQSTANPALRAGAEELIQVLLEMHGVGLERMLDVVWEAGAAGERIIHEELPQDDLVSSLLLLHGLHPWPLADRVQMALDKVRPYLQSHGGNVEVVGIQDGVVRLRLQGSCQSCPASAMTLKYAVEDAIYEAAPDVVEVLAIGEERPSAPAFVSLEQVAVGNGSEPSSEQSHWHKVENLAGLPPQTRAVTQCELCSLEIPSVRHRHLLEVETRQVLCACDACALRFYDVVGGKYKLIPRGARLLPDFHITDAQWNSLAIPINLAFFFYSTPEEKLVAMYPSPAGATESLLSLDEWETLVAHNPVLADMEPDVEALLVNRVEAAREYYLAPIDTCYRLVGLIRVHWRGLSGGKAVWQKIEQFFAHLI